MDRYPEKPFAQPNSAPLIGFLEGRGAMCCVFLLCFVLRMREEKRREEKRKVRFYERGVYKVR